MQGSPALSWTSAALHISTSLHFRGRGVGAGSKLEALERRDGEPLRETAGPSHIGSMEFASMHDLAANQAAPGLQVFAQSAGNTETQDGSAAFGNGSFNKASEVGCIATAHHGVDVG
jgi:hypothetical protein